IGIGRPGFKKQHAITPAFRQSGGNHGPSGSRAGHDKIKRFIGVAHSRPSPGLRTGPPVRATTPAAFANVIAAKGNKPSARAASKLTWPHERAIVLDPPGGSLDLKSPL